MARVQAMFEGEVAREGEMAGAVAARPDTGAAKRLAIYAGIDGIAVLCTTALLIRRVSHDGWSGEDVFFLHLVPLLVIGGGLTAAMRIRKAKPYRAEAIAALLVLPAILVLWVILASFLP